MTTTTVATLQAVFTADTRSFDRGLGRVSSGVDGVSSTVSNSMNTIGNAIVNAGKMGGAAFAGMSAYGLSVFNGFERQMNEVFTLMPGISQEAMDSMTDDVRTYSNVLGVLPSELIPALYQSLSAGVPPNNVFEFLETANMAAIGGVTDLETAVDGITSTVNAYGSDILSAGEASDAMFTAVRLGKTTFDEMARSLYNVVPFAASVGVGFDNVAASISTLTSQGVPTNVATTQIRSALQELADTTTSAGKAFEEAAGTSFREFISAGGDMSEALQILEAQSEATGIPIDQMFGSIEAAQAILGLTGTNAETFAAHIEEMGGAAGATEAAYNTMNKGVSASMRNLRASFEVAAGALGGLLAPAFQAVIDVVTNFLRYIGFVLVDGDELNDWLTHLPEPLQGIALAVGNGVNALKSFAGNIRNLVSAIAMGTPVVEAIHDAFGIMIPQEIVDIIETVAEGISDFVRRFVKAEDILVAIGLAISAVVLPAIAGVAATIGTFVAGFAIVIAGIAMLRTAWETNFLGIRDIVASVGEGIGSVVESVVGFISTLIDAFNAGGLGEAFNTLKDSFFDGLRSIWDISVDIAAEIYNAIILPIINAIATYVQSGEIWADLKTLGENAWEVLKDGVALGLQAAGDALGWLNTNVFSPIANAVVSYITSGELWENLKTLGGNILSTIALGIVSVSTWVFDNVITPLASAFEEYVGGGQLWEDLKLLGASVLAGILAGILAIGMIGVWVWENIISPFATAVAAYIGQGQLWTDLKSLGESFLKGVLEGINVVGAIVDWVFTNFIQPIINAIADAIVDVTSAAADVGQALWDGITGAISGIGEWIYNNVIGPVLNFIKDLESKINKLLGRGEKDSGSWAAGGTNFSGGGQYAGGNSGGGSVGFGDQGGWNGTPWTGYSSGTPWTGHGNRLQPMGIVHAREAVVPSTGMKVIPSPRGLMVEGGLSSNGGGSGGQSIIIQNLHIAAESVEDLYDELARVARFRGQ